MDYNKLVEQRNRENPFAAYVGIVTTKIEDGYAEAELTLRPEHMNPVNIVHGGCLYTLADVVTGAAASSFGTQTVTVSGEYHYLTSAKDTKKIKAHAKCLKRGKTLVTFDVEVTDDNGNLVGKGTFTSYRLQKEVITLD